MRVAKPTLDGYNGSSMTHKSLFLLGRQPAIGRAELESLFGAEHLEPIGELAIACDIPVDDIPFDRMGGAIRLARPLTASPSANWPQVSKHLMKLLRKEIDFLPKEGKIKLGVSAFGLDVPTPHLLRTGLELKKIAKAGGRSARVVPNTEPALNTAQVLHNQLTGELGIELMAIKHGNGMYIARTVAIQDITAYAQRDQGRPKRDAFVGMLPPKLAQTIINLGTGQLPPHIDTVVLDPFCGTGVVLQEALLMGYGAYGTDLEPRMVDYSRQNLEWLATYGVDSSVALEDGDATTHRWQHPFTVVACETYLGRPLSGWPDPEKLQEIAGTCNVIIEKFMRNLAAQIPSGTRLCLAVPAWRSPNGRTKHLTTLDHLEVLGYNRVSFEYARAEEMVYHRPDQIVGRELLVLIRK
jgi:SAM-dependent methyltransferase